MSWREFAEDFGGIWGEHPNYSVEEWVSEAQADDTRLGYWEWVINQIEQEEPVDELPGNIIFYVDGSFRPTCSRGGWGWVAVSSDRLVAEDYGVTGFDAWSRNIDGECESVLEAIKWAKSKNLKRMRILHDYTGLSRWANGKWRAKSKVAQRYKLKFLESKMKVDFTLVKGHSNNKWNDYVDKLCKKGIDKYLINKNYYSK